MSFRDDGDALLARLAALEHEASQTDELRLRISQLEHANELLRAKVADLQAQLPRGKEIPQEEYVAELLADAERRHRKATRQRMMPAPRHPMTKDEITAAIRGVLTAVERLDAGGHLETTLPIHETLLLAKAFERASDADAKAVAREDLADAIRDVLTSRLILRAGADVTIDSVAEAIIGQLL